MLYFDSRGVSRCYAFSLREGELSWWRDDPDFRQRFTISVQTRGLGLSGKGQMSREGGPWEADLELQYLRAGAKGAVGTPSVM